MIVLLGLLAIAGGAAHAAPGQRPGCMVAEILLRRPVTMYLSTTTFTWSVRGNSRFVLLDTLGQASTVDEDAEAGLSTPRARRCTPGAPFGTTRRQLNGRGARSSMDSRGIRAHREWAGSSCISEHDVPRKRCGWSDPGLTTVRGEAPAISKAIDFWMTPRQI